VISVSNARRASSKEELAVGKMFRPVTAAEWEHSTARLARESELNRLRSWERIPAVHAWRVAATPMPRTANETVVRSQAEPGVWRTREIRPIETPLGTSRTGMSGLRREPVRILSPMLPRTAR